MSLIKLLALGLLIWLGLSLLKKIRQKRKFRYNSHHKKSSKMLACSVCKLRIPEDEAIIKNGKIYCSKTHLK